MIFFSYFINTSIICLVAAHSYAFGSESSICIFACAFTSSHKA